MQKLGTGILTWPAGERKSDRYGTIFLIALQGDIDPIDLASIEEGRHGQLTDADAQTAERLLKPAYREKSLQYHPDRYTHLSPLMKVQAEQVHRSVEQGHGILTDPAKRRLYDKKLAEWKGPVSTNGFPIYDWQFQAELKRRPMTDMDTARTWIKRGWSIMILKVREGFDLRVQFTEAVQKHFENYLDQEG